MDTPPKRSERVKISRCSSPISHSPIASKPPKPTPARSSPRPARTCSPPATPIGPKSAARPSSSTAPDSPVTQTFGLGLFEPLTAEVLDEIESWFTTRGAPVQHEICPLVGVEALDLLCARGYRPLEIASVLHQPVPEPSISNHEHRVDLISPDQIELWSEISARAWSHEHPEFEQMLRDFGGITANRQNSPCFLAYATDNGRTEPAAAGALSIHHGVGTVPRRGHAARVPPPRPAIRTSLRAAAPRSRRRLRTRHDGRGSRRRVAAQR